MPYDSQAAWEGVPVSESGPALTVAALARRLGVAPATLRTWDRRYGLGPSEHLPGAHRRYAPSDVARLEVMRRLTHEGVSPGEAARVALVGEANGSLATLTSVPTMGGERSPAAAGGWPADRAGTEAESIEAREARAGGGRVVAMPGATPAARGLARAALAMDARATSEIVDASLERRGVTATWDQLLVPVLVAVGARWEATGKGVEVEHLLTECVMGSFRGVVSRVQRPINPRPVLLASAENEMHSLPLHALAAALAERQVSVRVLGPRVPRDALVAAVRRSGPAAVFVWSQGPATGYGDELAALFAVRPLPAVLVGGPGWSEQLPADVRRVSDLSEAVEGVLRAVGV